MIAPIIRDSSYHILAFEILMGNSDKNETISIDETISIVEKAYDAIMRQEMPS